MKNETVSTLGSTEWYISGRAQGNTTRQIDKAIQLLFEGYRVMLQDHHEDGNNEIANKNLFDRLRDRLVIEHRLSDKDVKIEKVRNYWTIELKEK